MILQIVLVLTPALVSALVGYLLGKRSQKFQIIREYITETVKDEYPPYSLKSKEISESLIGKAKPEVVNFLQCYKELKTQNDREVKEKLLPLLKKYISNPV